ncbi:hypothetical protein B0O80DRAFT_70297 [Mortierella sp. GBAus27b]|nr:hypothetical protein B0O80DRAFT_70297 [Mortierella sp. GBAus27b]
MENGANQPNAVTDAALSIPSTTAAVPNPSSSAVIATLSQSLAHSTDMTLTTSVQDSQVDISTTTTSDTVQTMFSGSADISVTTISQDSPIAESSHIMLEEPSTPQLDSSPVADNVIPNLTPNKSTSGSGQEFTIMEAGTGSQGKDSHEQPPLHFPLLRVRPRQQ